ncbi:MAG: hypothetical protein CM1200mP2_11540 [Planctomycetaceae bacterium]|nr:MAG: hypothetical protein CM1200mP2_11540 [Planctomycetaceae bacterium]
MVVPICVMGLWANGSTRWLAPPRPSRFPTYSETASADPFGLISVSLIVFFMTFNLIAQFKGEHILKTLLGPIDAFTSLAASLPDWIGSLCSQGNEYLLCLVVFGVAVIVYTTYGGSTRWSGPTSCRAW